MQKTEVIRIVCGLDIYALVYLQKAATPPYSHGLYRTYTMMYTYINSKHIVINFLVLKFTVRSAVKLYTLHTKILYLNTQRSICRSSIMIGITVNFPVRYYSDHSRFSGSRVPNHVLISTYFQAYPYSILVCLYCTHDVAWPRYVRRE